MAKKPSYACPKCGATGIRLFRQADACDPYVSCAQCLTKDGVRRLSDRFWWWVPAVPTPGGSWYQYSHVPAADATWWYALPEKL